MIYGYVSEPHRGGEHLVINASNENGVIRCHDLSGFMGSWIMKDGGVFFATQSEAESHSYSINSELPKKNRAALKKWAIEHLLLARDGN